MIGKKLFRFLSTRASENLNLLANTVSALKNLRTIVVSEFCSSVNKLVNSL